MTRSFRPSHQWPRFPCFFFVYDLLAFTLLTWLLYFHYKPSPGCTGMSLDIHFFPPPLLFSPFLVAGCRFAARGGLRVMPACTNLIAHLLLVVTYPAGHPFDRIDVFRPICLLLSTALCIFCARRTTVRYRFESAKARTPPCFLFIFFHSRGTLLPPT